MTEVEWLTSTDPQAMLTFLVNSVRGVTYDNPTIAAGVPLITSRKLRLFACACARQAWDGTPCQPCRGTGNIYPVVPDGSAFGRRSLGQCPACHGTGRAGGLTDPRVRQAVEVAERYADGEATHDELTEAYYDGARPNENVSLAVRWCSTGHTGYTAYEKARNTAQELRGAGQSPAVQSALLRCLCGNPWQPVTLCGMARKPFHNQFAHVDVNGGFWLEGECPACAPILAWADGTVPAMAYSIYTHRLWEDLPILADALEEAGCPVDEACTRCEGGRVPAFMDGEKIGSDYYRVLVWNAGTCPSCHGTGRVGHPLPAHLRDGGPHARGCHVLDLLLGYK